MIPVRPVIWTVLLCLGLMPSARADEGVTGTYKNKNGDVLVQQTADGRIKFSVSAAYKTNVGEVSGEVPLNGSAASYADQDADCALVQVLARQPRCNARWLLRNGLNVSGSGINEVGGRTAGTARQDAGYTQRIASACLWTGFLIGGLDEAEPGVAGDLPQAREVAHADG